jgi:hypothetical protein
MTYVAHAAAPRDATANLNRNDEFRMTNGWAGVAEMIRTLVAGQVLRLIPLGAGHPPTPKGYGATGSRAPAEADQFIRVNPPKSDHRSTSGRFSMTNGRGGRRGDDLGVGCRRKRCRGSRLATAVHDAVGVDGRSELCGNRGYGHATKCLLRRIRAGLATGSHPPAYGFGATGCEFCPPWLASGCFRRFPVNSGCFRPLFKKCARPHGPS